MRDSSAPVAMAMLLVVVSFSASLSTSHWLVRSIDERALLLLRDTIPSFEQLSAARQALRLTATDVTRCVVEGCDAESVTESVKAARHSRDDALETLAALPTSPREAVMLRELRSRIAAVDEATDRTLAAAEAGSKREAATKLSQSLQPRLAAAEEAVDGLQQWNADQAREVTAHILDIRSRAMRMAVSLGAASLAIALIATALVLRLLRRRAALVRENARMLEERGNELEAFAGRVAHDLRDPLNALTLQVEVLAHQGTPGQDAARLSRAVLRQLDRMRRVVDGLLEFARQGGVAVPGGADLSEVLQDVAAEIRPRAEAAGVTLRIEPFAPVRLACSAAALRSILSNLLGNAIKYVVEGCGPATVTMRARDGGDTARIEIEDNGPGMPPGAEEEIFEPFRRLAGNRQPGVGLGLATVKKIVETCRGQIGVASELGKGSVFWFEMPKSSGAP
jgi:signal transduction histidine kinase